jgi:hypothetical protein
MALTLTNVSYPGYLVDKIITRIFSDAYFVKQVQPQIIRGVKGSYFKHYIKADTTLRAYADCPSATGTDVNLEQASGTLCKFYDYGEISHAALESSAFQLALKQGAQSTPLDVPIVMAAIVEQVTGSFGEKIDEMLLNGATAYGSPCDGYIKKLTDDTDVIVSGDTTYGPAFTAAGITNSNVVSQFAAILKASNKKLRYQTNPAKQLKFFVAANVMESWNQAITQTAASGTYDPSRPAPAIYGGMYPVIPLVNLRDNTIILTYSDNFMVVLDSDLDNSQLVVTNQQLADAKCKRLHWRIDSRFALDYNYGEDIVLHVF